ncbi:MAG: MOSC domain-containing protein [Bradymonadia bacterium]
MSEQLDLQHKTAAELEAGLPHIEASPKDAGVLKFLVRRPGTNQREVITEAVLDVTEGLVGDNWKARGSRRTEDGSAHPRMQLNIMNARAVALIAGDTSRWALAGDQLYLDLDLSDENLPPGTRLSLGEAVIEITEIPHNGCKKFTERYGLDAVKFVNSKVGKALHLRGVNARVIEGGTIKVGDVARKIS